MSSTTSVIIHGEIFQAVAFALFASLAFYFIIYVIRIFTR